MFICSRDPNQTKVKNGGVSLSRSNYNFLRSIGEVDTFSIFSDTYQNTNMNWLTRALYLTLGYLAGLTPCKQKKLVLLANRYDIAFIDHSLYGRLARYLRESNPRLYIITHFHNVEELYYLRSVNAPRFIKYCFAKCAGFNEKMALKYSDKTIVLTEKDQITLASLHKFRSNCIVVPLCLDDPPRTQGTSPILPAYLLFCGSNFAPNIEGINWFIKNVLPKIDIPLVIAGNNISQGLKLNSFAENVIVIDSPESLDGLYEHATAIIAPIFTGTGMKTKTIEALRFGKTLFATPHALEGVGDREVMGIHECSDADKFISAINFFLSHPPCTYSNEIRNFFIKKFSSQAKAKALNKGLGL